MTTTPRMAPWPDFAGNPIHEGDIIQHPGGELAEVVFVQGGDTPHRQWRVQYEEKWDHSYALALQVGDMGRATVVHSAVSGKLYLKPCPFCASTKLRFDTSETAREDPDRLHSVVFCEDCECRGPYPDEADGTKEAAERRAADRWNRRAGGSAS